MGEMMTKPKLATVWLGGCSGCHMSFLDLDERLLDLAAHIELCYSPIADAKEFPENVDIALVEGALVNHDHIEEIRKIRERTKILVAFGDCAVTGNVAAMRNPIPLAEVVRTAYGDVKPGPELPVLLERAEPLHSEVLIDHYLPGCPPPAQRIFDLVVHLLEGSAPHEDGMKRFG